MIYTTLEIHAEPSRVRQMLLDFTKIPTWHTGFITSINLISKDGGRQTQDRVVKNAEPDQAKTESPPQQIYPQKDDSLSGVMGGVNFTAVVLESSPNVFSWTGPPFYHLFRGIHTFRFSPSENTPGATTFVQEESFTGFFSWVMAEEGPVGGRVKGMFEGFNRDLKEAVEKEGKG